MADEKKPLEEGDKKVTVDAEATVSNHEGVDTHKVDVSAEATVRDLSEKRDEKAEERDDSGDVVIEAGGTRITIQPNAIDVDSPDAHKAASHKADRPTAKATAAVPASFAASGRPD